MNWRRGLGRAALYASIIWFLGVAAFAARDWYEFTYPTASPGHDWDVIEPVDWQYYAKLGLLPPLAVAAIAAGFWVAAGFKP